MNALYTTLIIALLSALIATILGTAAAIGIQAMRKKMRTVVTGVTNIPMLNADLQESLLCCYSSHVDFPLDLRQS